MALSFRYIDFDYRIKNNNLEIGFEFRNSIGTVFKPKTVIKNIKNTKDIDVFVFNLGMIELISYWKATLEQEIVIECGYLNKDQIKWWKNLYIKGMGEFFYNNKIDFRKKDFLEIIIESDKKFKKVSVKNRGILLPIGGGKDSVVSLELLKKEKPLLFSLNSAKEAKNVIGRNKTVFVQREIDKQLLELNRKGYYNGHTPFSAYLAFLTLLCAFLTKKRYIVLSNEKSANEETMIYLGKKINHQYSKTLEFENDFRNYTKKYIVNGIEYFSFLRPLYELQIAKLFAKSKKYFSKFLSCNEANKTCSGTKKKIEKWCGKCPKCLFVFTILYPFMNEKDLIKIFNKNLLNDKTLIKVMNFLMTSKPFECVGTREEALIAFYLSYKKAGNEYYLLDYFEKNILKKEKNLEKRSQKILNNWDSKNNLPVQFAKYLHDYGF